MADMGEPLSMREDGKKRSWLDAGLLESQSKYERYRQFDGAASFVSSCEDVLLDANFHVDSLGLVSVVLSSDCLVWQDLENKLDIGIICCWGSPGNNDALNQLAISEIYAVESSETSFADQDRAHPSTAWSEVVFNEVHHFTVHSYQKSSNQKGTWIPKTFVFQHTDQGVCERWANQIQSLLDKDIKRPKNLLVIINPHSGKKTALKTWEEVSSLFKRAKINTKVLKTERIRHAFEVMNNASNEELAFCDFP